MVDAKPYMERIKFIAESTYELGHDFKISEARAVDEALTEIGKLAAEWFKDCAAEGEASCV